MDDLSYQAAECEDAADCCPDPTRAAALYERAAGLWDAAFADLLDVRFAPSEKLRKPSAPEAVS